MYKFIFSLFITLFCLTAAAACIGFSHGVCLGADGGPDDGSTGHYDANGFHRDGQAPPPQLQLPQPQLPPLQPQLHWINNYGAIAIDNETKQYSTTTDSDTKQEAIDGVVNACNQKAHTTKCIMLGWYSDQCVALVWGKSIFNKKYVTSPIVQYGKTIAIAERQAIHYCAKDATDCVVKYSDCSHDTQAYY